MDTSKNYIKNVNFQEIMTPTPGTSQGGFVVKEYKL